MTPCNTPATPPNFPDTLIAFSRMTTSSENSKLGSSPSEYNYIMYQIKCINYLFSYFINVLSNQTCIIFKTKTCVAKCIPT